MAAKKQVFVTGATSELMLQVLSKVDTSVYDIIGLTRSTDPPQIRGIRWIQGDIRIPSSYKDILANCHIIIHAAAITHSRDERKYFEVNLEGTKNLINAIPPQRAPRFIFISSRVAGSNSGAYGISKLQAENEVRILRHWLIIRPSEIYGQDSKNEGIEKTIRSALKGGVQLCPLGVKSKMYPIHLSDAANEIYKNAFEQTGENRISVLNGPKGYSFETILKIVERVSGKKILIVNVPKWILQTVAYMAKLLPIDPGFVPDQVDRLYSIKEHSSGVQERMSLEKYIENQYVGLQ